MKQTLAEQSLETGINALMEQIEPVEQAMFANQFEARHLHQIKVDSVWIEANNLLGDGFLRREGGLLLAAPTGRVSGTRPNFRIRGAHDCFSSCHRSRFSTTKGESPDDSLSDLLV